MRRTLLLAIAMAVCLTVTTASASTTFIPERRHPRFAEEIDSLRAELTDAKRKLAAERKRSASYQRQATRYRIKYLKSKRVWSRSDVRWVTRRALKHYRIPKSEWKWVLGANQTIIFGYGPKTPRESSGDTKETGNPPYLGLHQWSPSWSGTRADKLNGFWSCYRFVRVYRDGGKPKVRQHWEQTIGPYR